MTGKCGNDWDFHVSCTLSGNSLLLRSGFPGLSTWWLKPWKLGVFPLWDTPLSRAVSWFLTKLTFISREPFHTSFPSVRVAFCAVGCRRKGLLSEYFICLCSLEKYLPRFQLARWGMGSNPAVEAWNLVWANSCMQFTQLFWVRPAWLLDHNGNYPRSFKQLMKWPRTHHTQCLEDSGPSCRVTLCSYSIWLWQVCRHRQSLKQKQNHASSPLFLPLFTWLNAAMPTCG